MKPHFTALEVALPWAALSLIGYKAGDDYWLYVGAFMVVATAVFELYFRHLDREIAAVNKELARLRSEDHPQC